MGDQSTLLMPFEWWPLRRLVGTRSSASVMLTVRSSEHATTHDMSSTYLT